MKIPLTAEQLAALKQFLNTCEDAEQLSESEYVVDLYDLEPPVSLDLVFKKGSCFADGAAELLFDEEMNGWYIGSAIESAEAVVEALASAGALGA